MWKRLMICLLVLVMPLSALSEDARRVFSAEETEPFPENAGLLTLRVCPLMGADCMLLTVDGHSMLIDAGKKDDPSAEKIDRDGPLLGRSRRAGRGKVLLRRATARKPGILFGNA